VEKIYTRAYKNWLDRKGPYEEYIVEVIKAFEQNIKGVHYDEFSKVAEKVADFHKNRVYRYSQGIIKDLEKEKLLSFEEDVQFIFSHSALKEGWDNPNIF